jgi:hypothetical protein
MLRDFKRISSMRIFPITALVLLLSFTAMATAMAHDKRKSETACRVGDPQCLPGTDVPSKHDLKAAHKHFERAKRLMNDGELMEAADELDEAIRLAPNVAEYVQTREVVRQKMVAIHMDRGNDLLASQQIVAAMGEFELALAIDPSSAYARERMRDAAHQASPPEAQQTALSPNLTVVSQSRPIVLAPQATFHELHFKGNAHTVLEQVAGAYGMKLVFDDSVSNKTIRFDMDGADFFTALREGMQVSHSFWVALTPKQLIIFNDTQALRRAYEHTVSSTFYLSDATSPQELTEVVSLLRTLFDVRFAVAQPSNNSVVVRAPGPTVEAAEKVLGNLLSRKPQVSLQVQVYAVSQSLMRALGIAEPTQFQAINVGLAALGLLGQGNVQDLINQLIASGGINSTNSQGLQSLLSQLQNQQTSSLLQTLSQNPFATFGGGKSLFAVPFSGITGTAQLNTSDLQSVQTVILRAAQGNAATLKIGERYPILNASFAPIFNTPAISQVIQNGSYQAPFPSVSYEDLGLDLKVTPQVQSDSSISLKIEMQIKALAGQSLNGVPVLSNREYTASLSVLDGTTTAVAGMITQSEQKSLSGLPGFSAVPGFGTVTSTHNKTIDYEELLIVITPTIVSPAKSNADGAEVWMAGGN